MRLSRITRRGNNSTRTNNALVITNLAISRVVGFPELDPNGQCANSGIVITFVLLTAFCSSPGSVQGNKLRGPGPDSGAAMAAARVFENFGRMPSSGTAIPAKKWLGAPVRE
jgi:hypothetical protein